MGIQSEGCTYNINCDSLIKEKALPCWEQDSTYMKVKSGCFTFSIIIIYFGILCQYLNNKLNNDMLLS